VAVPEPLAVSLAPTRALESLLTVDEVAGLLRLRPSTVRAYAERGSLPCVRIGGRLRFRPSDVRLWIEQRHSKGAK
jgi:excisionase family DNA binding protein